MNSRFTDKQIEKYASAFRDGDAVWYNNNWREVMEEIGFGKLAIKLGGDDLIINFRENHRVITLSDYELQGGEKIVWLGESDGSRTFGKTYNVNVHSYYNDKSYVAPISSSRWGIIPRYNQVKNNKPTNADITLTLKDIEKLNQFNSVFHDSKHLVELLDSLGNHEQANELMQNLLSVKEVVDSVNKQRNQIAKELLRKECNL